MRPRSLATSKSVWASDSERSAEKSLTSERQTLVTDRKVFLVGVALPGQPVFVVDKVLVHRKPQAAPCRLQSRVCFNELFEDVANTRARLDVERSAGLANRIPSRRKKQSLDFHAPILALGPPGGSRPRRGGGVLQPRNDLRMHP